MAPPMTNVSAMVMLMSMPIIAAAVRSWAVARMALPSRVRWTKRVSPIINGTAITMTSKSFKVNRTSVLM